MSFVRELFDHAVRYRRLRRFTALGPRRAAAARTYLRHAISALRGEAVASGPGWETIAGFEMRYLSAEWMRYLYREVFAQQEYLFTTATPRPVILDCGGNIGMSTLFFKALYPDATIAVFEPAPWAAAAIEETLRANALRGVTVHNVALAESEGELEFHHDANDPGSALMSVHPLGSHGDSIRVPAVRLSTFVDGPVDFMKLDVEGSEMPVLREMSASGKLALVHQLVVEYHHHASPGEDALAECLSLLERNGFGYQITGQVYTPITQGQFQGLMLYAYRKSPR